MKTPCLTDFYVNLNFNFTIELRLLVELNTEDALERGQHLNDLWDKFETFFHRKVDLLTNSSIRNPILRSSIDATKVLIYDREGLKVSF